MAIYTALQIDEALHLRPGTTLRAARSGAVQHLRLPGGQIRFRDADVLHMAAVVGGDGASARRGPPGRTGCN
jgi:hypothetical protein